MSEASLRFPYNIDAVKAVTGINTDTIIINNHTYSLADAVIYLDSSWTDTPSIDLVTNKPEVGPPIRRLRSYNVLHTMPISFDIDNFWYNRLWLPFIYALHGGIDKFLFPEITYNKDALAGSTDINLVEAWFDVSNGSPFNVKRKDNYTYVVSATVCWISEDKIEHAD